MPEDVDLELIITEGAKFELAMGNPDKLGPFVDNVLKKTPYKLAVALAYLIKKLADKRDTAIADFAAQDLERMARLRSQLKGIIRLIWRIFFRIGGVKRKITEAVGNMYITPKSFTTTLGDAGFYKPTIALFETAISAGAQETDSNYVKARTAVLEDPTAVDVVIRRQIYDDLWAYLSVNQVHVKKVDIFGEDEDGDVVVVRQSEFRFDDEVYPSEGNHSSFSNSFADLPIASLMVLLHVLGNSNLMKNMRVKQTRDGFTHVSAIFRYAQYLLAVNDVWYWGNIFRGQTELNDVMSTVPADFNDTVLSVDSEPFTVVEERLEEPQGVLDLADFAAGDSLDKELDAAVEMLEEQPVEGEGKLLEEEDWGTDW
jgi:hypothetical protein